MKTQHIIPLLLLVGYCAASAQTTNSTPTKNTPAPKKTMNCTLTFTESQKKIANPTEADIRAALNIHINGDLGSIFDIGTDETVKVYTAIQVDKMGVNKFSFEYKPNDNEIWISKKENFSAEESMKILMAFRNGSADWMQPLEWRNEKL